MRPGLYAAECRLRIPRYNGSGRSQRIGAEGRAAERAGAFEWGLLRAVIRTMGECLSGFGSVVAPA